MDTVQWDHDWQEKNTAQKIRHAQWDRDLDKPEIDQSDSERREMDTSQWDFYF